MNAHEQMVDEYLELVTADQYEQVDDPPARATHAFIPYRGTLINVTGCATNGCGASRLHPLHLVRP